MRDRLRVVWVVSRLSSMISFARKRDRRRLKLRVSSLKSMDWTCRIIVQSRAIEGLDDSNRRFE
jgi:hypothetical protein